VVERLGTDLRQEFPGLRGFSARKIWYMRKFYLCYRENQKLQPMVAEIGWTHNLIILDKCKDDHEREFYLRMTRQHGWTKNVLALRIEDQTYEKTLLGQNNFEETLPASISPQAKLAVRDEYTLKEQDSLRSQFVTLKRGQHSKYPPFAVTEQSVAC